MNFYSVQIGNETRRGHFNESHSFVCQSENTQNEVYKHYLKKYSGFTIICKDLKKVETLTTEPVLDTVYMGQNKYDIEISKLKRQIKNITESTKTTTIYMRLDKSFYPEETKLALVECEKFEKEARKQKEIAIGHIKTYLLDKYDGFIDEVYSDDGFSQHKSDFSYRMNLKGKMAQEFETNK